MMCHCISKVWRTIGVTFFNSTVDMCPVLLTKKAVLLIPLQCMDAMWNAVPSSS